MKIFTLSMLLTLGALSGWAQSATVSGTITEADTGEPLIGATIVEQGTTNGTVTDLDGRFQMTASSPDAILEVSYIGFQTQVIPLNGRTRLDIVLELDMQQLDEIVVVGYGSVRKSDLTGSVSSIKSEDLVKIPASNPLQALQGKVAGVQVNNFSGAPGAAPTVRVRGVGTFNNNNPVYVVDGVILDDIGFINASDIASMEVLKDASATAIYGSRGANGVIMITTKRGKKGQQKPIYNASAEWSVQTLQKQIDLLNGKQFAEVVNIITPGTYNNLDALSNTNWQDELFENALIQNYQFSVAGASDKSQYYLSLGYFKQDGIIPKSSYERVSLRINNDYQLNDWFKLGHNLSIIPQKSQGTNGGAPFNVYRAQPVIAPYNPDGTYSEVPGVGNVLADIEYTNSYSNGVRMVGNFFLEARFAKNFQFRTSFGPDFSYNESKSYTPQFFVSATQNNAIDDVNRRYSKVANWLWENTVSYNQQFDKHRIDAVIGYTAQDNNNQFIGGSGQNLLRPGEDFWYLTQNNLVPSSIGNGVSDINNFYSMISYLGRVNYAFDNRYLFTATFRQDGSSKFIGDNRWGFFPSFAIGWNLINENFMRSFPMLSNAKLRASYGIVGNEKIPYLEVYSEVNDGINGVFGASEEQFIGQTFGRLGNPDLKWESTETLDFGFEWGLFEDKLQGEVDYFQKTTSDILVGLQVPGYFGNNGASVFYNAGEVKNQGWEFITTWQEDRGDFNYRISGNLTLLKNNTEKVSGTGGSDDALTASFNGFTVTRTVPGIPIGSFYGYRTAGIYQNVEEINASPHLASAQPGDIIFVDTNEDGNINTSDFVNLGSPIPTYMYGLSFSTSYKRFDFSLDLQGQGGNKIYNLKEIVRPGLYNYEAHVYDYWRGEGTSNSEPRPTAGGPNFSPSDRFIYDGDFLRLRNVTLSYNLPEGLLSNSLKVRVFVSGTNLITWTKFPGYSPEVANGGAIFNGIDTSTYPVSTVYSGGLNLSF